MYYKFKKILYFFIILSSFSIFIFTIFFQITYYNFSSTNIKSNINTISAKDFGGRKSGTLGNFKTAKMIEKVFINCKLKKINNSYTDSFIYENNNKKINLTNVYGILEGSSNSLPPLIISAHFDTEYCSSNGISYGGALDNASGTCFLLEMCRNLSSMTKPKRTIIFAAFDGEELGLRGSQYFYKKHKKLLKDSIIINLDMIGAKDSPLIIMSKENSQNSKLQNDFEKLCLEQNFSYYTTHKNLSDHASFTDFSCDSVTLCHSDFSRIHTMKDISEYIDENSINSVYLIVKQEINDLAYNRLALLLYNTNISLFFLVLSMTLILYCKLLKNKDYRII